MDLSIVIVNWKSKNYLRKCIATIMNSTKGVDYEIVVIDGGSFDGCGEMLKSNYPEVRFFQNDKNLGFARANNFAFAVACGRNFLFLNPDTEVQYNAIQTLLCQLESLPNAGIVGAKLLNTDKSIQTSCIRAFPSIFSEILDSEVLKRRFPRSYLWGTAPLFDPKNAPARVDAVSGACLMIKRSVFENVGVFSNDYFMYSEDIDLCFKVRQGGWKTYYIPDAIVVHHGGKCSSQRSLNIFSDVMMLESRWRFFRKTRSNAYSRLYRIAMFSVSLIRIWLLSFSLPFFSTRGKGASIIIALKRWIARLRWTLGFEGWVNKY